MLTKEQKELYDYMSDLSGEAWEAGWSMHWEYELWDALEKDKEMIGRLEFSKEVKNKLMGLVKKCGGWITYKNLDDTEETFITINEWKNINNSH